MSDSRVANAALEGLEERRKREVVEEGPSPEPVEVLDEVEAEKPEPAAKVEEGVIALDERETALADLAERMPEEDLADVER